MKKQIVINASKDRSRIAIVEDGELVELYIETPDNVRSIGNVYLAEVQKVMPALRAAFVDVGEKQDCFLHFSDLTDNLPQLLALAGEDVPGLDEPVLSLAPPKRVADDENEPDVEESLEIEPAPEESRSRRTSRRRSRGRGRGRGRGQGRREEEEEQEETPRRKMPSVIDLSAPAKPRRQPAPEPEPESAPKSSDTPEPDASSADASASVEEAAPKKKRTRSRKAATSEKDTAATEEAEASSEPESQEEEAAPKKKRTRSRKATAPKKVDDAVTEEPEASSEPESQEEAAPKKKRARSRKAATPKETDDAVVEEAEASSEPDSSEEAAPKKKRTRSRKASTPKPTEDAPAEDTPVATSEATESSSDAENSEETAPTKKRRRGGRGRGTSDAASSDEPTDAEPAALAEPTDETSAEEKKPSKPRRSRSRKSEAAEAESADGVSKSDDEPSKETPRSGRKSLPAMLDLTSSAKPKRSEASGDEAEDESADAPSRGRRSKAGGESTDAPDRGRGRRNSRSDDSSNGSADESSPRGFKKPASAADVQARDDDDQDGNAQDDADTDGTSSRRRSGRGRKTSDASNESDAESTDDAKSDDDSKESGGRGRGRSRGGRSEGGRSEGGRSTRETSSDDSASDGSSKPSSSDDSNGRSGRGRSDRSGDGGSGNGRSSGRDGGSSQRGSGRNSIPSNEQLLKRGGRIIVKITKEAISNKGPRVSTDLSLAGRFLVLVPAADYVAVSKKIESAKERRRLRTLATNLKPDGFGVIIRTVAEGRDAKSLDTDLRLLADKWRKIQNKLNEKPNPPVLLYQDVNMVSSVIRDLFSEDYDRILVDDEKVFRNVQAYVKAVAPQMMDKVELHKGRGQVYRSIGIEKQVEEAFSKRVNMKSGGYLFIETTEAMHVVDVNSGRAGRGKSQKQNLIDVNVEAAKEVAKQLRLRDLGGIIVVDFIDLKYDRDRRKVTDALKKAFDKDRAVTKLLPMSDFGLVQITRQRLRPSITANAVDEDGEPLDGLDAMAASGASEIVQPGKSLDVGLEPDSMLPRDDDRSDRDDRSNRDDRSRRSRPRRDDSPQRTAVAPEDATPQALAGRLRGWLEHYRQSVGQEYRGRPIVVRVHPLLGEYLRRGFISTITRWRLSSTRGITFSVEEDAAVDPLTFEVRDQKSGRSLLKKYDS